MSKADLASLEATIEKAFDEREAITTATRGETREAIEAALDLLDRGAARVAERQDDGVWKVNQWLKKAVLLPSFVNLGAYVDSGTMVDTWASVGSCAQIGKNVHLSGGVGIGGVLEP